MFGRNFAGRGQREGMGYGFRGNTPPWPYVGRGRGGLPRCGYYARGATGDRDFSVPENKEGELSYLSDQAKAIKEQLNNIESRMRDLEAKE